ncbi:uncharacterized protein [Drosophila kikkawai]|uniref:Uncharacterized protein n=1 Tax=Drosophila kikkawai TaxID=30033 RepID=A0A6P4IN21_DROKI|nr:uncharacterized protein LOC108080222 [Drosophila kikkawai]KAH8345211.1 hypothetical protein KR059_008952 [Drosophila kikkawai]
MASQWIIFTCALLAAISIASAGEKDSQLGDSTQKLDLLLEAINELESQRVKENTSDWKLKEDSAKQRPNSKRLRWNRRSNGIPENRRFAAYSSSISYPPNPDYINVKDYEPTPAPWWFNIN